MTRGRRKLSFFLSLSLALMLVMPGRLALAEQSLASHGDSTEAEGTAVVYDMPSASTNESSGDGAASSEQEGYPAENVSDEQSPSETPADGDQNGFATSEPTDGLVNNPTDEASVSDSTQGEPGDEGSAGDSESAGVDDDDNAGIEAEIVHVESETPENDGDIALRTEAAKSWVRIAGYNAYATMQKILQTEDVFADKRGGTVIVATGDGYWDALSATGLAGTLDAPIIITPMNELDIHASQELTRLEPTEVIVMGGSQAIGDGVIDQIKQVLPDAVVTRLWGATAPDTSLEAYKVGSGWGNTAIVSTNQGYWDALSIAPYAFAYKAPIFLTSSSNSISSSALEAIQEGGFSTVIITGGPNAVSASVEDQIKQTGVSVVRIGGKDAIDTSGMIAKWECSNGMTLTHLTVATSAGYWDALSAAALCGKQNSVLVLVSPNGDYRALDAVYDYGDTVVEHGHILGGTNAIAKNAYSRVTAPWTITALNVDSTCVRKGSKITANVVGSGIPADTTYAWSWKKTDAGSSSVSVAGSSNSQTITLSSEGTIAITCKGTAPDGSTSSLTRNVNVYNLRSLKMSVSGNTIKLTPDMAVPVSSIQGCQYRFTWSRVGSSGSGVLKNWSSSSTCTTSATKFGGSSKIKFTVEVKDSAGSVGSKSVTFSPDAMTIKAQGYSSPTNYLVMVDDTNCWIGIYTGYKGNWTRVQYFRCSTGGGGRTPKGVFSIGSRGYSFSGDGYTCYWYTDFYLGLYAFHSVLYQPGSYDIKDGRLGYHISAGCVRLDIKNAKWIYNNVPYGSTVVIYN